MKKLLLGAILLASCSIVQAEEKVWFNLGSVDFNVPFASVSAVGLWDGVSNKVLAGAETPLIAWESLQITGGAVTTVESDAAGTPFLGVHVAIPNPLENFVPLASFNPGLFGGRNFRTDEWMFGIKASLGLF